MNKILVTGADGLVGSRFVELFPRKELLLAPKFPDFDLTKRTSLIKYINDKKIGSVIHFAAYTDVSSAEKERNDKKGNCWRINVEGTKNLIEVLGNIHFVYISTDMVFTGSANDPGPYEESHDVKSDSSSLSWYGFTKAITEGIVKDCFKNNATIVRLIYPVRAKFNMKLDYLRKPLRLYDEGKLYPMFKDQRVSISSIDEISDMLIKVLENKNYGTFHASSRDTGSPFEIISYLIEKARGKKDVVTGISMEEFLKTVDNPVRYPKYGGLSVTETEKKLELKFSSWREIIDKLITQGIGKK